MSNISEIGIITITTIIASLLIIIIKIINKSKCENFECLYGLFKVHRNIQAETDIENNKIEHNIKDDDNININDVLSNIKNNNIIK